MHLVRSGKLIACLTALVGVGVVVASAVAVGAAFISVT